MPTPEEEFDALTTEEQEFDSLGATAPAGVTPISSPEDIPAQEYPSENKRPWYDEGVVAGARRGMYGNLGNKLADILLPQDPNNTYAGDTPGQSLERNFQEEREAHPWKVGAGQIASSIAPAVLAGAAGGAVGTSAGSVVPGTAGWVAQGVGRVLGSGLGGGAVPFAAQTYAEQEGTPSERVEGTKNFVEEHPIMSSVAVAAPFVGEAVAPALSAVGGKLVDAGNKGLARIGLGPAELARLRAIGGESKLAQFGQKMRDAGLDKGRDIIQKFTPTDAKRIADNANEIVGGHGPKIGQLEDELLASNNFGQNEIDTAPLTSELRSYVRPNSAETSTPKIARAMEKQAQRFESVPESVDVQGSFQEPPPLPNYSQPQLPPNYTPLTPVQGELPLPPAKPWQPPANPNNTQGRMDLGVQQPIDFPARPPLDLSQATQSSIDFPPNDPSQSSFLFPNPNQPAPHPGPLLGGRAPMPLRQTEGNLPFPETQTELPIPPRAPMQQNLPLPAPEAPPVADVVADVGLPTPPPQQLAIPPQQLEMGLPPGGKIQRGEFPTGGTTKPLSGEAQLSDPYTVERAVADKRDIGAQLFDKKQRALKPNYGEDKAREISWGFLKDRFQKELDNAVGNGQLTPSKVAGYRKASADFNVAADVTVDAARRAEQDLQRAAGFWKGGLEATRDAAPGTKYNLGRLLQGGAEAKPAGNAGVAATLSAQDRQKLEKKANDDMKQNIFRSWYNTLSGR